MNGFEKALYKTMQAGHAEIIIDAFGESLNTTMIIPWIKQHHSDIVEHITPSSIKHALLTTEHDNEPSVITIKGVDPITAPQVTSMQQQLTIQEILSRTLNHPNTIIIGHGIAQQHHLTIDQKATILLPIKNNNQITDHTLSFDTQTVTIGNIIKTGIDDIDNNIIVTSLNTMEQWFGDQDHTHLEIKLKNGIHKPHALSILNNSTNLHVYSWEDLYTPLVSAMALEKFAMSIVLLIVAFIATTNIISLTHIMIIQKKTDLALLLACGATPWNIRALFLYIGLYIGTVASLVGIGIGFLISKLIARYPCITLPDIYFSPYLITEISTKTVGLIFISFIVIIIAATITCLMQMKTEKTTLILRQD